jgi:hypothetical protein
MIRPSGGKHEREASGGRGYRLLAALACDRPSIRGSWAAENRTPRVGWPLGFGGSFPWWRRLLGRLPHVAEAFCPPGGLQFLGN